MSSHSDDSTRSAPPSAQPFGTSEVVYSLEDGVLERYLRGTLRPDEIEAATLFFSDPIRAQALHNLQIWAKQLPDAKPSEKAQKLAELWEKICDQETPGSPSFVVAATRAGKASTAFGQIIPSKPALGKHTLRTARQKEGVFSRQTLRRMTWLLGTAVVAILSFLIVGQKMPVHEETTHTYSTKFGQQASFTLRDGTRVTLAPNSTLRLWRFGSSSRTVNLDGQAYFEVAHTSGAPFRVVTGDFATNVLGTAFAVRHYSQDKRMHIAIAEGKVTVQPAVSAGSATFSPVTLTAGQVGDVTDSTVLVNTVTDLTPETDWLRGKLVFRHALVSDVLLTLTRWYGYQFRCTDPTLAQRHVTGALEAGSSASALATLELTLNVSMTVVGDTVTLTPHGKGASTKTPRTHAYDVWIPTREVGR